MTSSGYRSSFANRGTVRVRERRESKDQVQFRHNRINLLRPRRLGVAWLAVVAFTRSAGLRGMF